MVSCLFQRVDLVNCSPCCQLAVCWILSWVRQAVDNRIAFLVSIIFLPSNYRRGEIEQGFCQKGGRVEVLRLLSRRGKGRVRAFISKGGRVDVRLHSMWAAKTTASIQIIFCRVLNTDNMSIVGVTIDYGPFGFLDYYDPNYMSQASGKW